MIRTYGTHLPVGDFVTALEGSLGVCGDSVTGFAVLQSSSTVPDHDWERFGVSGAMPVEMPLATRFHFLVADVTGVGGGDGDE